MKLLDKTKDPNDKSSLSTFDIKNKQMVFYLESGNENTMNLL